MAITLVQSLSVSPNASPIIKAFTSNIAAGDLILFNLAVSSGGVPSNFSVSDNLNGAYTAIVPNGLFNRFSFWIVATVAGIPTITATWSGTTNFTGTQYAWSGWVGTPTVDPTIQSNTNIANGSSVNILSLTNAFPNELLFTNEVANVSLISQSGGWTTPLISQEGYAIQPYINTKKRIMIYSAPTGVNWSMMGWYDSGAQSNPIANVTLSPNATINVISYSNASLNLASISLLAQNINLAFANGTNTSNVDLESFYANSNGTAANVLSIFGATFPAANVPYTINLTSNTITYNVNSVGGLFAQTSITIPLENYSILYN